MLDLDWLVEYRKGGHLDDRRFSLLLRYWYRVNGDYEAMMAAAEALDVEEDEDDSH
jgi:hypothetical protein